jgi:hypothetical protein
MDSEKDLTEIAEASDENELSGVVSESGSLNDISQDLQNTPVQSDTQNFYHIDPFTEKSSANKIQCSPTVDNSKSGSQKPSDVQIKQNEQQQQNSDSNDSENFEVVEFNCSGVDEGTENKKPQLEGGSNEDHCINAQQEPDYSSISELPADEFDGIDSTSNNVAGFYFRDLRKLSVDERLELRINRRHGGVVVTRLIEQSSAEQAGLLQNDIIINIDGRDINSERNVISIFKQHTVGDTLELIVLRGGDVQLETIFVELTRVHWGMSPQKNVDNSYVFFESFIAADLCNTNEEGSAKIDEHAIEPAGNEEAEPADEEGSAKIDEQAERAGNEQAERAGNEQAEPAGNEEAELADNEQARSFCERFCQCFCQCFRS